MVLCKLWLIKAVLNLTLQNDMKLSSEKLKRNNKSWNSMRYENDIPRTLVRNNKKMKRDEHTSSDSSVRNINVSTH